VKPHMQVKPSQPTYMVVASAGAVQGAHSSPNYRGHPNSERFQLGYIPMTRHSRMERICTLLMVLARHHCIGQRTRPSTRPRLIARLLLSHSADVHAVSNDGKTPLHFANALGIAKALIEQGADARAVDNSGQSAVDSTAMFLFTPEERHSLVSFLVGHGAERAQN
jgi:hypothetical protein